MGVLDIQELNRRLRIERKVADDSFDAAETWVEVATVWAGVRDVLPSRAERLANGFNIAARPSRVRIRYRGDVTPAMRFVLLRWDGSAYQVEREMEIVAGPAELGRREGEEFMAGDYQPATSQA